MDLKEIKGIGPKTEALFRKLGVSTAEELLRYYPVSYEEYTEPVKCTEVVPGAKNAVSARIISSPVLRSYGGKKILTAELADETGTLKAIWFNAPFLAGMLKKGSVYIFRGNVSRKGTLLTIEHPEILTFAKYDELKSSLVPVYGLTKGLSGKAVAKAVLQLLDSGKSEVHEYLPESMIRLHGLLDEKEALRGIHFPKNQEEMKEARRRIVFDEFFLFILGVRHMKQAADDSPNRYPMTAVWETEELIDSLPFRLTKAQLRVWHEIERDLASEKLMSRLVQGDVGSGKTVIAFLAMLQTAVNGYQSSLMAPTEVLAVQHFEKLRKLKEEHGLDALRPVLLTGSMKAAEKREALRRIESGEANAVVGTHALIQSTVSYRNLALIITDEQHRFGVRQRSALMRSDAVPNTLVMSATPIPRTLGVIYYGDLDISVIDQMPSRRLPIRTAVVDDGYYENAVRFIGKQLAEGRQAYVICPMIEPSEEFSAPDVLSETERLKKHFPDQAVEMLHGRMKPEEKERVMQRVLSGEIRILVSTTVIEVGVDVPNASVMLVMGAERFGLAQLHQLRGRVGRGEYQSYCIFMAGMKSKETEERLTVLKESNDGFVIAEKDLELRGPGDLLGIRQSGEALFRLADPARDGEILKAAGETARSLLADDPAMLHEENELLRAEFTRYLESSERSMVL